MFIKNWGLFEKSIISNFSWLYHLSIFLSPESKKAFKASEKTSELGKVYFWRAAIKPGRPIAVGKINKCYIICLPGNPVSVQLLYAMLVKPLIEKLSGGNFKLPSSSKITANFSMKKKTKRMEWLRVNKETINNKNIANKFPKQGSGMISSISYSDGIIEIDENVSQVNKGDIFDFYNYESLF